MKKMGTLRFFPRLEGMKEEEKKKKKKNKNKNNQNQTKRKKKKMKMKKKSVFLPMRDIEKKQMSINCWEKESENHIEIKGSTL